MDVAFNTVTKRLVASEELWELEVVDKNIYYCPGCSVPLIPASYLKTNKKRPYFRCLKAKPHKIDCAYNENSKLIKIAQSQSISNEDGFPLPYPSKLIIEDKRTEKSNDNNTDNPATITTRNRLNKYGLGETKPNHHRTVSTIKNIVRHYIYFPYDRDVHLVVPYVSSDQTTYNSIFKNIWGGDTYTNNHIFYSKIFWIKAQEHKDYIEVKLMAGKWEDKVQKRACMLRVNIESSKERQRGLVLHEIRTTIQEAIENRDEVSGYIFFLGKQDEKDKFLFHTNSHKLISCLTIPKKTKSILIQNSNK
jgi:hypothetical protein